MSNTEKNRITRFAPRFLSRKSTSFLLVITAVITLSACKKILELYPQQAIISEVALGDDEGVKEALIGAYDSFSSDGLFGGGVLRNSELYAGQNEVVWLGTYVGPKEIYNQDILTTNGEVSGLWGSGYNLISRCNNVLSALSVVNEDDRNRVEGEAKFLRGWVLFELTKYFGQQYETGGANSQLGVPVITSPSLSSTDNAFVERNTVEECYTQVISDLTDAKNLLPESNGFFASTYAASALLARVYLQQGKYDLALPEADRVIASGMYYLVSNYANEFGQDNNTTEDIFAVQISGQDGNNAMNESFATSAYGGRGDIQIQDAFVDSYDTSDARAALYYQVGLKWRTGKFNNQDGNIALIRVAEMYLTRAECNERLGTSTGAAPVDDYNVTHVRAALPAATSITLDDILRERHFELAHEGFLLHDQKRRHENCGSLAYNDVKMIYPIPEGQIVIDPNLEQNPGY